MTADEILADLQSLGSESYKKILFNHGAREPVFGVKIEELKKIQKKVKKNYRLALDLFKSGNYDAQYLAGLIADETQMTKGDLEAWLAAGNCPAICGTTVADLTAESTHGMELARKWIDSGDENTALTGWAVLSGILSITNDAKLDITEFKKLLKRVEKSIHSQPNQVRYAMNGFVIALGAYVGELTVEAIAAGEKIGLVRVDMGKTACKVPSAPDYIRKIQARGTIGKKRKSARC